MEAAFNTLYSEFHSEKGYGGNAVYHYDTYKVLPGVSSEVIPKDAAHVRDVYTYFNPEFTPGADMNTFLAFCAQQNVRTTFYQSTDGLMKSYNANLTKYLQTAQSKGMKVELLAGQSYWASSDTKSRASLTDYMNEVIAYYKTLEITE